MKVGNEDRLYLGETNARAPQLHLCTLAAVYHKILAAYLDNLRRSIMLQRWQGAAAT